MWGSKSLGGFRSSVVLEGFRGFRGFKSLIGLFDLLGLAGLAGLEIHLLFQKLLTYNNVNLKMGNLKLTILFLLTFIFFSNVSVGQSNDKKQDSESYLPETIIVDAEFPGGTKAWNDFLSKNVNTDVAKEKGCPAGRYQTLSFFWINKEGYIDTIIRKTHFGYGMEEEVARVIKLSPKWIPAKRNGRCIKELKRLPITFVVGTEKDVKKNNN